MLAIVMASQTELAPDPTSTQNTMTATFNAVNQITGYAHALLNTVLTPATTPPADWYTDFNTHLQSAQKHAQQWIDVLGPDITAQIPQSIINYNNIFQAATNQILSILSSSNDNPSIDQKGQIIALITATLTQLGQEKQSIVSLQTQLQTFASNIATDHTNLVGGANAAQQAINVDQQKIDSINAQIDAIQQEIAKNSVAATASEIGIGLGIFLAVAAFALAIATGGAAAPLVVGVIAVLGVGAAVATTTVYSVKVNQEIAQLHQLQNELGDEERQVTALQGIVSSTNGLVQQNEAAQQALSNVLTVWDTLEGKLNSVISDLQNAEADTVGILQALHIETAQTAWNQLQTFATNMQNSILTIQPPLVQPSLN